jgi:protein ImuB
VDRWACVSLPALPLQLVTRQNPAWRGLATVVVSEDKPQGKVLWANESARQAGVLPGHTYALALSLCAGLRACVVSEQEVAAVRHEIKALLWRFSPAIEAAQETGVFWLDASGLSRMFVSLSNWASGLRQQLMEAGLSASVVVGFSRFGSYALARCGESCVLPDPNAERVRVARVPLARLDLEPTLRDVLSKLGVHTVDDFLALPAAGLLTRFGSDAARLHALALGAYAPLDAETWVAPLMERQLLDTGETDSTRLLFVIKRLLTGLLAQLVRRGEALTSLSLSFKLDRKRGLLELEALRPAAPTLDGVQLIDLVRLRLESLALETGVIELSLSATGTPSSPEQLRVFAEQPRRDLAAAARAIARLRAEFGPEVVVRAVLCDGHLPEARYRWQPIDTLQLPEPPPPSAASAAADGEPTGSTTALEAMLAYRPLVRRIQRRPETLSAPARQMRNDGWLIRGAHHGPVTHSAGPYVVNGGWWQREVQREYSFLMTRRGELLWVYQDKRRRRWFLHGEVQ